MLETTDFVVVGLRALAFIAVVQAAGCALYGTAFAARYKRSISVQQTATLTAALCGIALIVAEHASEPARMAASFSGIWDSSLQLILLQSDSGSARAVRVLGLATIAWGTISKHELRGTLALVGAVITLSSFTMMGHTASHPQRWLLAVLLLVHLLVAAFWFGALIAFIIGAKRELLSEFGAVVKDFSVIATWLVPSIPVAGLAMAVVLLPDIDALSTPYGRLLILKVLGFSGLITLAAWNKFRLAPALAKQDLRALRQFRRVIGFEWAALALILAITATMTSLFGPE